MTKRRGWTDEELAVAVKESTSYAQVRRKLKLKGSGSHKAVKERVSELDLNVDHFTGQLWSKGKTILDDSRIKGNKPSDVFSKESKASSGYIKKLLLKYELVPYRCECGITDEWRGKKITLQLDHVDGNNKNNTIENLRFLCPNCHSQTDTYCGKNKKAFRKKVSDEALIKALKEQPNIRQALLTVGLDNGRNYTRAKKLLKSIDEPFNLTKRKEESVRNKKEKPLLLKSCARSGCPKKHKNKMFCSQVCYKLNSRQVPRPPRDQLLKELENSSYAALGRKYGVSDNAIRKWVMQSRCPKGQENSNLSVGTDKSLHIGRH